MVFQGREFGGANFAVEFAFQDAGILFTNAEADDGADITKHGGTERVGKLCGVLVKKGKSQAVLAGFGERSAEGFGGEVLEFVDVHRLKSGRSPDGDAPRSMAAC